MKPPPVSITCTDLTLRFPVYGVDDPASTYCCQRRHHRRPGQTSFGILQIDSRRPRQFTDEDTSFLRSYANLLAAAVDRLHVLEDVRDDEQRLRLALDAGELGSWRLGCRPAAP